jgi:photosystem II stability/assembly factor-like uncharacterized protein
MKASKSKTIASSRRIRKLWAMVFQFVFMLYWLSGEAGYAHSPHDDIFDVELSPNYEQDKTLFVLIRGNLLKSTDQGRSWSRVVRGLDNLSEISSVAIDSRNKQILFVSTLNDGVYKSEDGGNSWFKANQGLKTLEIEFVEISLDSPDIAFAAGSDRGLYKTTNGGKDWFAIKEDLRQFSAIKAFSNYVLASDVQGNLHISKDGGRTWQPKIPFTNSGIIKDIAISKNFASDRTIFLGTDQGGVFKTTDGGVSFSQANDGITDLAVMSLAISPTYETDGLIFASSHTKGVFYSENRGRTWKLYNQGLTKHNQADALKRPHFSKLRISNTTSNHKTLYVAGFNGLFQSVMGQNSWTEIDNTLSMGIITGVALSPNYQNDSTIAISTYLGGAFLSKNAGVSWKPINHGLGESRHDYIARLFNIFFSPNYISDKTIFSALWTRFLKSKNEGKNWTQIQVGDPGKIQRSIIVPSPKFGSDQKIYLGTIQGNIFVSTDRGNTFTLLGSVDQSIESLVISPNFASDNTLYFSTYTGKIYKTLDGGKTWQLATNGLELPVNNKLTNVLNKSTVMSDEGHGGGNIIRLAISPNYGTDGTLVAGTNKGIFKSIDQGKRWIKLVRTPFDEDSYIEAIAISPNYQFDQTFMVSVRGIGLFRSRDRGETFIEVGKDLINNNQQVSNFTNFPTTYNPLIFSPSYRIDQTIYASSGTDLLRSTDGGDTWKTVALPEIRKKNVFDRIHLKIANSLPVSPTVAILTLVIIVIVFGVSGFAVRRCVSKIS